MLARPAISTVLATYKSFLYRTSDTITGLLADRITIMLQTRRHGLLQQLTASILLLFVSCCLNHQHSVVLVVEAAPSLTKLMDAATGNIQSIPGEAVSGITTVVTSPGTPSRVLSSSSAIPSDKDVDSVLLAALDEGTLVCRGATLGTATTMGDAAQDDEELTCRALAVCALVSDCLVIDGVTVGDVESGLRNSRHARTLSALFRSRLMTAAAEDSAAAVDRRSYSPCREAMWMKPASSRMWKLSLRPLPWSAKRAWEASRICTTSALCPAIPRYVYCCFDLL